MSTLGDWTAEVYENEDRGTRELRIHLDGRWVTYISKDDLDAEHMASLADRINDPSRQQVIENNELIQEDPGPDPRASTLAAWLDDVRGCPGAWFKYPEPKSSAVASQIKNGQGYGAQPGEFEVTRRLAVAGPPRLFWTFARTAPTREGKS